MSRSFVVQRSEKENLDIRLVSIDGSTQKSGIAYFCNGKYIEHVYWILVKIKIWKTDLSLCQKRYGRRLMSIDQILFI